MSDPTFSDIDFENKMTWVWTTLNSCTVCTTKDETSHEFDEIPFIRSFICCGSDCKGFQGIASNSASYWLILVKPCHCRILSLF